MTGSNIFSFASTRRKSKPLRDSIFDPLSQAEIKYVEAKMADDAPKSPSFTRKRRPERLPSGKASMASLNTYEGASQQIQTPSTPARLRKSSTKSDRYGGPRSMSNLHQTQVKREPSSSTLRSYYDRNKSPLAVSQQTSASSARDFALRKGCPPVVPTLHSDVSCPQTSDSMNLNSSEAPKKRPSRLDLSMLFPKPLPQSSVILSPHRYTSSPPPLSTTSEQPAKKHHSQSFLHDQDTSVVQEPVALHQAQSIRQPARKLGTSSAKMKAQKPRFRVQNWFDGVEGDISDDDANREPDMQPDFVENAFKPAASKLRLQAAPQLKGELEEQGWPKHSRDYQSSRGPQPSVSTRVVVAGNERSREAAQKFNASAKRPVGDKWSSMEYSRKSALTALDRADLREESVLCLSSSEDEDDSAYRRRQRLIPEQRGPFLRDSLGVDSIDSDVEIGTAQAVNTSFLRMCKPSVRSNGLLDGSSIQRTSKAQRLKAIDVPGRQSSQRVVQHAGPQMALPSFDEGILRSPFVDRGDHEPFSTKRLAKTGPIVEGKQSPLIMALTPQEASLLEAMRSRRASMRHNIPTEAHPVATEGTPPSKSPASQKAVLGHTFPEPSTHHQPARPDADAPSSRRICAANITSTELTLSSGRGSLMFSESLSSPTTGRDSPDTPTLDLAQDLNVFHDLDGFRDSGLHTPKKHHFGHARSRSGSPQIIVLDNFPQPRKDSTPSEEYPWMFGHLNELANIAMIH